MVQKCNICGKIASYFDANLGEWLCEECYKKNYNKVNLNDYRNNTYFDKYVEDVKAREAMSTTGIGDGVAIPHAKSAYVKFPTVIVGKSSKGIDWESLDDEPVNLVFLIAVPEGEGNEHLKILQVLAVSLMDDEFKDEIIAAKDKETICEMLLAKTNK